MALADEAKPLAIVTGAAHRLGRAFAIHLARSGYALLLHFHSSTEQAEQTEAEIVSLGVPVYRFAADLGDQAQITSLFSYADSLPHGLRVLVNSAAVMRRTEAREISYGEWESTFALNLEAPFVLAQQAAERMDSGGLIVNISDSGAQKVWTKYPAYVVSKSALESLTRVLAKSFAPTIRVNAIAPGLVLRPENMPLEEWGRLVDRLPLGRSPLVEEVVAALEFLLNNQAITGQVIGVDAGYCLL